MIEASDVIVQVLDARDPLGSRCEDLERMVQKAGPLKRIVLLLNKIGKCLKSTFHSETEGVVCNLSFQFCLYTPIFLVV